MGYVKSGSMASIIAGSISGIALLAAGALILWGKIDAGLIVGVLISVALAGQFVPKVVGNNAKIHVIIMAVLSIVSLILTLISFSKK